MSTIENIPLEIISLIIDYIDFFDLQSLSLTNKTLNLASKNFSSKIKTICDKVANQFLVDQRVISCIRINTRYLFILQYSLCDFDNLENHTILSYKIDLMTMVKIFGNSRIPTNYLLNSIPIHKLVDCLSKPQDNSEIINVI